MNATTAWTSEDLRVDVVRTALATGDTDAEGWSFRYHGQLGTEVHSKFRTQEAAKEAAVRYAETRTRLGM